MAMNIITTGKPRNKRTARPGANGNIHRGAQGKYARNDSRGETHLGNGCCGGCIYCSDQRVTLRSPQVTEFIGLDDSSTPVAAPHQGSYRPFRSESAGYQYDPIFVANAAKARPIQPTGERLMPDGRKVVYVTDRRQLATNVRRHIW